MIEIPYEITLKLKTEHQENLLQFKSTYGLLSKKSIRKPEINLVKNIEVEHNDDILHVDSDVGVAGITLSKKSPDGRTMLTDSDSKACLISQINVNENNPSRTEVMLTSNIRKDSLRKYDRVIYAPKPHHPDDLIKQKIIEANSVLREDGNIHISIKENELSNDLEDLLEQLNSNKEVKYDEEGYKIIKSVKGMDNTEVNFLRKHEIKHNIKGVEAEFETIESLFSPLQVHETTELLVKEVDDLHESDRVLDIGCGYGAIGIYLKKLYGVRVTFTDKDKYATMMTKKNLKRNNITDGEVINDDALDGIKEDKYEKIVFNPPRKMDKKVLMEIICGAYEKLENHGEFVFLEHKDYRYKSKVQKIFGNLKTDRVEGKKIVHSAKKRPET